MTIKKGFVIKEIAGQYVVVALGDASKVFNGIIKLNESGKLIWEMIANGKTRAQIIDTMLESYGDVDRQTAEADFDKFVAILKGANIIGE